jgi:transcriptional regulator GlxA family with amidase domain
MSMGRASPTTTVELATSREVPLGGNEYRKRSSMYTAPIQEALQMIRARISRAAIVDSLAQHVLCSIRRLFGAYGPPDEKYT